MKRARSSERKTPYDANINWEKASILFKQPLIRRQNNSSHPSVKNILHLLAGAGTVGLMFMFPGAAVGIGSLVLGERKYSRWRTKQVIYQLAKQQYIKVKEEDNGKTTVTIMRKGLAKALTYRLEDMQLAKPKKWDNKWRVIIFDIPEKYKKVRDIFRMRLRQLGLYQLQESVYVSPYKCFNEIEFLRELYGVAFTVRYLLVDKLEDDNFLRQHFEL